jgi:hypothetical protein
MGRMIRSERPGIISRISSRAETRVVPSHTFGFIRRTSLLRFLAMSASAGPTLELPASPFARSARATSRARQEAAAASFFAAEVRTPLAAASAAEGRTTPFLTPEPALSRYHRLYLVFISCMCVAGGRRARPPSRRARLRSPLPRPAAPPSALRAAALP